MSNHYGIVSGYAVILTLVAGLSAVNAHDLNIDIQPTPVVSAQTASKVHLASFDWLSKPIPAVTTQHRTNFAAANQKVGSGSWICSPAGFGRKSHCYSK